MIGLDWIKVSCVLRLPFVLLLEKKRSQLTVGMEHFAGELHLGRRKWVVPREGECCREDAPLIWRVLGSSIVFKENGSRESAWH